ncbi:LPS export ABC transporter permease LptG [Terriglobus tenax]|uniref:LPS export ABC transporter permease LptG n=1 Tax=Terriglobus tenax TaxID=1111115 RepID=UPI0021E00696|nr:LPS export ABC transporter permease LptG [Terriglobus tenax]
MRILTRYILRELLSHALLGGALFTFVLFMRDLGKILELVVRGSAPLTDVFRIFLYTVPNTLTLTLPMSVLVGVLLGLSRLAADSEVTAMRASGMGVLSFTRIVSIIAVGAFLLGLGNSLYLAPKAATALIQLENQLKQSQVSFEVQPRVFYEDFKDYVLYVQDVVPGVGAAQWKHVFLADLAHPASPLITTANEAIVVNGGNQTLRMSLHDGGQHQIAANDPNQYNISTFSETDLPISAGGPDDTHITRRNTPLLAMGIPELMRKDAPDITLRRIELQKRFSYPFACFVLVLVGVPLGLSSRRGGKSTGFVLTILLVFIYYLFSSIGESVARQGKLPVVVGVWAANVIFALAGITLLWRLSVETISLGKLATVGHWISSRLKRGKTGCAQPEDSSATRINDRVSRKTLWGFPLLLDDYVMRQFVASFAMVLASFISLSLIFSFFELIGDIIRNRTPLVTVGDYLINLIPYMLYNLAPLCALIAVLVTFGALNRTSEITAMKATGISLYRIAAPVIALAGVLAVSLFAFDEFYLPAANKRQEALRSVIKGRPAQTFLRPDRKWISGQASKAGEPTRIFYYQFFNPDQNAFANLTVFEFQPGSFTLQRRVFATSAHWDQSARQWILENGWQRTFDKEAVATYQPFTVSLFPEIHEQPGYFKKEVVAAQEMSFGDLASYINDLKQSGFDTMRLRVQLNHKLAYPLVTLVMAVLAIPFALSMGRKGSLTGIAAAIGLAIAYWVIAGLFEAMGNVNTLPPMLAAWSPDILFAFAGAYLLLRTPT